jgi:hypothetical protein
MGHANPPLTMRGKLILSQRVVAVRPCPATSVVRPADRGTDPRHPSSTANRYERDKPGELVHVDVKKLGRIPDGGGWRAHGRSEVVRGRGIGFDFVHVVIDDHSRLAYAEIYPDEKGTTAAGVLLRSAEFFSSRGTTRIERVISDNAFAYRNSTGFNNAVPQLGATRRFITQVVVQYT